jgi:hypothetical protein
VRIGSLIVVFVSLSWWFGGALGLAVAVAVTSLWWILRPPRAVVWGLAATLLAVTPIVLVLEGLPTSRVVGPQFGLHHLASHRLTVSSLLLVMFAALTELLHIDRSDGHTAEG